MCLSVYGFVYPRLYDNHVQLTRVVRLSYEYSFVNFVK